MIEIGGRNTSLSSAIPVASSPPNLHDLSLKVRFGSCRLYWVQYAALDIL